jgi:hypothetical protein
MVGQLRDERSGSFQSQTGGRFETDPTAQFAQATYFYLDPVVRVGVRFAEHWELSGQLQALLLIALASPRWNNDEELGAGSDGIGTYDDETLMGPFLAMFAPGISLRYTIPSGPSGAPSNLPTDSEPSEPRAKGAVSRR